MPNTVPVPNGRASISPAGRTVVNDDRTAGDDRFLIPRQFDATQRKFRYDVNPTAGKATPSVNFPLSQFQMQLGLRYNF